MEAKNIVALIGFLVLGPQLYYKHAKPYPEYDAEEPYFKLDGLWTPNELDSLRELLKSQKEFRSAAQDSTSKQVSLEISGPVNPATGSCPHKYMAPDANNASNCILPGRVDMFEHYAMTGGKYGAKEPLDKLVSNIQSFQRYLFGEDLDRPEFQSLFNSDQYKESAEGVCGSDYPIYKRVQVNLIVMLPGQDLPMHFDLPWFKNGANRFNLPQWLLLAMAGSRLWHDEMLPQVQGVAYIHDIDKIKGGDFFLYPKGPGGPVVSLESRVNSGIVVDGIRVIHGVQRYRPNDLVPSIDKRQHMLIYDDKTDLWWLQNENGDKIQSYHTSDLRVSLVWRSICFKSEKDRDSWDPQSSSFDGENALKVLENDLRKRGILAKEQPRPEPVDFALLLVDTYVKYPIDNWQNAWFPFNYCMLPEILPKGVAGFVNNMFKLVC